MTGPDYDAELEAFLKRRSPMHRRLSDIDHAEPSVELDRLVLNRARDAIDTPSQPLFRSSRWALPVGLAASIFIAFTVVLNIDHNGTKGAKPLASVSPAAEGHTAPAAAPRAASIREPARADQPRVLTDSATLEAHAEKKAEAPAALAKRSELLKSADVATGSASSPPLTASSGAASSSLSTEASPTPGMARATASARSARPAAAVTPAADVAADPHSSPDAWLREINRLRTAGRTADADRELAAFREAYPTHPAYSVAKPPAR